MKVNKAKESALTQDRLKYLLNYDENTGIFTRLVSTSTNSKAGKIVGSLRTDGYLTVHIDGYAYFLHRLVWLYVYGTWPNYTIDHIDRIRTNNRLCNLRDVTQRENNKNSSVMSEHIGVGFYPNKSINNWHSRIKYNGESIHLGCFATKESAMEAYNTGLTKVLNGTHPQD